MAIHFTKSFGIVFLLLIITGCAVGPHYKAPQPPTVTYHSADPQLVSDAPLNAQWWKQFDDQVLDSLVDQTLAANNTIRIARARLGQSRAIYDERKLDRYPVAPVDASYEYSKQQIPGFSDQRLTVNTFRTGFDAFWELDVFGRVSHGVAAGQADTQAFAADLRDVQISTVAELARNYFELRGAQWR
ncbi:MAG TPA: TolC family protein, partial [Candidatus Acidoferrum sp.]|nr:TolC family protein [Candidatus Acidoferrum sp.]